MDWEHLAPVCITIAVSSLALHMCITGIITAYFANRALFYKKVSETAARRAGILPEFLDDHGNEPGS